METKTIILSEKEGKRYELHLSNTKKDWSFNELPNGIDNLVIFSGSVSDFLNLPNKEEIAEKVCESDIIFPGFKNYSNSEQVECYPLESLMSAIGDYKYIIITETEI